MGNRCLAFAKNLMGWEKRCSVLQGIAGGFSQFYVAGYNMKVVANNLRLRYIQCS